MPMLRLSTVIRIHTIHVSVGQSFYGCFCIKCIKLISLDCGNNEQTDGGKKKSDQLWNTKEMRSILFEKNEFEFNVKWVKWFGVIIKFNEIFNSCELPRQIINSIFRAIFFFRSRTSFNNSSKLYVQCQWARKTFIGLLNGLKICHRATFFFIVFNDMMEHFPLLKYNLQSPFIDVNCQLSGVQNASTVLTLFPSRYYNRENATV